MRFELGLLLVLIASRTAGAFVINQPKTSLLTTKKHPSFSRSTHPLQALPPQTPAAAKEALEDITTFFDGINQDLSESFRSVLSTVLDDIETLAKQLTTIFSKIEQPASDVLTELFHNLNTAAADYVSQHPSLQPLYDTLLAELRSLPQLQSGVASSPAVVFALSSFVTYTAVSSILSLGKAPPPSKPYPLQRYDPIAARAYFDERLPLVLQRGLQIASTSLGFGVGILQDYVNNQLEENSEERAVELATLLTKLGPTFIKIGQSLSIRTDLLSPAYVRGLQTLQDQVPPFDSQTAKEILRDEWGVPVESVVESITPEPVAAASLGQVYRATLKEGVTIAAGEGEGGGEPRKSREVAIKIQRPDILEQIALDMHLLREFAPIAKRTFNLNTDTVGTVDAWGLGFVDELDYLAEARNAQFFTEGIGETPLKDVVFAPPVVEEYSTGKVLTTEWIEGERLDRSSNEDVTVLCSIAMNTYLTMMLETGLLHCDPHPGNLLRTPDGRLCILDWGMVTRLDSDIQITLIEHMAHLTSADYEEIPRDLLLLDFIPESKADLIKDSGVVEVLADIYGAWTKGGGAAAINVNQVISNLQDLTATKGNLFQIPPYFAYIAKSFSVLEGIGLSNDPKYSIINECLPYVSKRLLTDQSERTGGALSTFIFGPDKANVDTRIVDYDRVEQLVTGFGNYTTSASGALLGKEDLSRTELLESAADQVLDLIFTEEETPLQTIMIEQLAKIVTAESRSIWGQLRNASGTLPSGRTLLGTLVDPLGLWRSSPLVNTNQLDHRTVSTTRKLISLIQEQSQVSGNPIFDLSTISQQEAAELSMILGRKVWDRRAGLLKTGNRFAYQLLQLSVAKLESGERVPLPQRSESVNEAAPSAEAAVATVTTTAAASNSKPSDRLRNARQLLNQLENEREIVGTTEPALEMTPVKNKF